MPNLSIIVPVYNTEKYLNQCLSSIINQSFSDFELIIINDGSIDDSLNICQKFEARDDRIILVDQDNAGQQAAIIKGIRKAEGNYVGFVDSDDWIKSNMFEVLVGKMKSHDVDMVQSGVLKDGRHIDKTLTCNQEILLTDLTETILKPFFLKKATLYPITNSRWNKLYKREILLSIIEGLDKNLFIGEDLLFNITYLQKCRSVLILKDENNYCYRTNNQSISKKYTKKKRISCLNMIEQLKLFAQTFNYDDDAIEALRKETLCSLMLDALRSDLRIKEKLSDITWLAEELGDKKYLDVYALQRPLIAKIALAFLKAFI